ncbi:MAG: ASCH domain-containing protein [Burkholderiales bacterium]|nr:ASCH domain-containing protein [Burkholderiales bacterium]
MKRTLQLSLKAEYFDAIRDGRKTEEFRLATPFWRQRIEGKDFHRIVLTKGYPPRADASRRLELPWRGYVLKTITHPHFGRRPVTVYAIDVRRDPTEGPQT